MCESQEEVDHYWNALSAGGDASAQACGWFKDRYGLSWQVAPRILNEIVVGPDQARAQRAIAALMPMKKPDIAALLRAADGESPKRP